uniref:Uncharacterized protein n=1 Tax=Chromera velia CCMP2878 TaxID=1169474 RepID=A0A0G4HRS1_9ALVE|eukprot:Cvel_8120.t1-p1 / transcript=Cvel_8120.t1 / gene=Cvel_8120 / organism=Chromera_velia_CCMP2878 / gene_product=hypothetical protein / transcript_product=hypothetical protein / location=Cvel_scaffold441:82820-83876(+) / protein_length=314 / sequence_SO=supercontig / SO=protein_coding / is_pseudo=false
MLEKGVVRHLVSRGANLSARDAREESPLVLAAGGGHLSVVQFLLTLGDVVDVTEVGVEWDGVGTTAEEAAVLGGYREVVRVLKIAAEKPPVVSAAEATDMLRWMPEHVSFDLGAVQFLLGAGADLDPETFNSDDFDWTEELLDEEAYMLLIEKGARIPPFKRQHVMLSAVQSGWMRLLDHLLSTGLQVNQRVGIPSGERLGPAHEEEYFLHVAYRLSSLAVVQRLVSWGADVNLMNREGKTTLDFVDERGRADTRDLLENRGGMKGMDMARDWLLREYDSEDASEDEGDEDEDEDGEGEEGGESESDGEGGGGE